jgi:intracellular septation protein A
MKNLIYAAKPLALDLGSTLLFVIISAITHNPMLATAVAIAAGVARIVWLRARRERINALQWMSLGLVVVFGGATLLTHNPQFMMAKPTIVYLLIGAAMLQRGWMLPYMPPQAREHVGEGVMVGWGYAWAGLMFVTAALNAGFALTASFAVWSAFIAIFPAASKIALFAVQFLSIRYVAIRNGRARHAASQAAVA